MIKIFSKRKESDAKRIYTIYKNVDITERINYIVDSEYKRMIYLAEKTALDGKVSFTFELDTKQMDEIHFNRILNRFINKLIDNEFRYSRQMLKSRNRLTIYFSHIDI